MNIVLTVGSKILKGTEEEENNSAYRCQANVSTETDAQIGAAKTHEERGCCWQRQVMGITAEALKQQKRVRKQHNQGNWTTEHEMESQTKTGDLIRRVHFAKEYESLCQPGLLW